jgi:hypothetical protein
MIGKYRAAAGSIGLDAGGCAGQAQMKNEGVLLGFSTKPI